MTDYERGRLAGFAEGVEAAREAAQTVIRVWATGTGTRVHEVVDGAIRALRAPSPAAGAACQFPGCWYPDSDPHTHPGGLTDYLAPSPATGRDPRCTCGSGGHPRRCALHPEEFDRHCAELNEDGQADTPAPSPVTYRVRCPEGIPGCMCQEDADPDPSPYPKEDAPRSLTREEKKALRDWLAQPPRPDDHHHPYKAKEDAPRCEACDEERSITRAGGSVYVNPMAAHTCMRGTGRSTTGGGR